MANFKIKDKFAYFDAIFSVMFITTVLFCCGFFAHECKKDEEYRNLPKQTWVEPQQQFDLNGKKCQIYYIYTGIKDPKLNCQKEVVGRFVKCEDNNQPIKLEVNKGKFGWQ